MDTSGFIKRPCYRVRAGVWVMGACVGDSRPEPTPSEGRETFTLVHADTDLNGKEALSAACVSVYDGL